MPGPSYSGPDSVCLSDEFVEIGGCLAGIDWKCRMCVCAGFCRVSFALNSQKQKKFFRNAARNFKHIKPLEQDRFDRMVEPLRHLMAQPTTSSGTGVNASGDAKNKKKSRRNRRESQCDHSEEGFECILCFDKRCGKCKGESAFCYKVSGKIQNIIGKIFKKN